MLDREYYPLDMVAKMLDCDTDKLVYLAANGKLIIHLLTDGNSYTTVYCDEEEGYWIDYFLPKIVPVLQFYWQRLEAGIDTDVLVDVTDCQHEPSGLNYRPFSTCTSNIKPKFVILREDLEKLSESFKAAHDAPKVKAVVTDDWKINARTIAEQFHKENNKLTVDQLATKTYTEMTIRKKKGETGMTGRGDKVPSAGTIKRHALTGIKA